MSSSLLGLGVQTCANLTFTCSATSFSCKAWIQHVGRYGIVLLVSKIGVFVPAITCNHWSWSLINCPTVSFSLTEPMTIFIWACSRMLYGDSHCMPPYPAGPKTTARGILEWYPAAARLVPIIFFCMFSSCRAENPTTGAQ